MKDQQNLSDHAREFIAAVNEAVADWHNRPLLADHRRSATLARLKGLAADIIRILDSADGRDWETYDLIYEVCCENDIDVLLAVPTDATLDHRLNSAMKVLSERSEGDPP